MVIVSAARTLVLDATLAVVPPRWQSQLAPDLYWGLKDPGDTLDYSVSLVAWLGDIDDTIATVSCSITPMSAAVTIATNAAGVITTAISGGVVGQRYGVPWTVTTTGGRVVDFTVWLDCADRAGQPGQSAAALGYQLPVASTVALGGVIVGANLSVNAGGTLSAMTFGGGDIPAGVTAELLGASGTAGTASLVTLGSGVTLSNGTLTVGAGAGSVTEVVAGAGLGGGTITSTGTLTLEPASATGLGGVVVGAGLAVNAGGTISNTGVLSLGTIIPETVVGSLLGTDGALNSASAIAVGPNLSLANGTLAAAAPGTGTVTSLVAGRGLSGGTIVETGTIALDVATDTALGGIIVGAGLAVNTGGTVSNSGVLNLGTIIPTAPGGALLGTSGVLNDASAIVLGANLSITNGTLNASGGFAGGVSTIETGAGLGGGPITAAGTVYAATPVTTTYTASGTIAVSDVVSLVNAVSAAAMTLSAGVVDGHCITVKRLGAGAVSVAATIDGASETVEMVSATVRESVSLTWNAGNATWLLV